MAKKTTKKAAGGKKASLARSKKKTPGPKADHVEIELDPVEVQAYELAYSSDTVCKELELAVTSAVSRAIRKVFKLHRISLTLPQADELALLLFGD